MHSSSTGGLRLCCILPCSLLLLSAAGTSVAAPVAVPTNGIYIVKADRVIEVMPAGATTWVQTGPGQTLQSFDRLRTGPNSTVAIHWSDQSIITFGEQTEIEVLPAYQAEAEAGLHFWRGILSFFHRGEPGHIRVISPGAVAGIDGTEFVMLVDTAGDIERTSLAVIDGIVSLSNPRGILVLTNGQSAVAQAGQAPLLTAGFINNNVLQWCLYYPGVLDVNELALIPDEARVLADSLSAYRAGDLLAALSAYPATRVPGSDNERVYYAALLLSVGQVSKAEPLLDPLLGPVPSDRSARLALALRHLIAAVKHDADPAAVQFEPQLATEFLAASYYEQAQAMQDASLRRALLWAKRATSSSPGFGFAWARVAELEFGFGNIEAAGRALHRALALAPRNAEALSLRGFVAAAQNQTRDAIVWFNQAITVDGGLANAWLGRGLCRVRRGDARGGRDDLLVAAALEPQRAFLRSYLGKAYADAGDVDRASHELDLAKTLDAADPTAWLYSALVRQQENRLNEGIGDLEKSQELNDNRKVYRSRFLLDQDRAVRSVNLARLYRDAGMLDVSLREAGRAVSADYANYSAHLFLASSYDELRDPNRIHLRFETPAENEYLIANLLAPVGAGVLAQSISQQDYSKLFEQDRVGVASSTEYLSRGAWVEQGAQFGTFGNSSYLLEGRYHSDPGQRLNNDFMERELRLHFKEQITARDTLYLGLTDYEAEGGDRFQFYHPTLPFDEGGPNLSLRTRERQEPLLFLGAHHEWSPGSHTILLAGRFDDAYEVKDPQDSILVRGEFLGELGSVRPLNIRQIARTSLEIYSGELQQIWQTPTRTTILGGLVQEGDFRVRNLHFQPSDLAGIFTEPPVPQVVEPHFDRMSVYAYQSIRVADPILLIGGVAHDRLTFPENFRSAPMSDREAKVERTLPKAGAVWTPAAATAIRGAYTRSLAGASLDQSFRLEPTQVAGFNQAFRSIIPEAVAGANAGARFETYDVSVEHKFDTRTYVALSGQLLYSQVSRTDGAYTLDLDVSDFVFPTRIRERLDYRERSVLFTVDQLIGSEWTVGGRFQLTDARLHNEFPEVSSTTLVYPPFQASPRADSLLHQLNLHLVYTHPSGALGQFEALWNSQRNRGYSPDRPGDDFWQFNVLAGYHLRGGSVRFTVGVLDLTGNDYRLNPLTLYRELPRQRTFIVRLHFGF